MGKKYKVVQTEGFARSLNAIPDEDKEEVFNELGNLFKGMKDGTISPDEVGKPVDMEKLKEEEPELFEELINSSKEYEESQTKENKQ